MKFATFSRRLSKSLVDLNRNADVRGFSIARVTAGDLGNNYHVYGVNANTSNRLHTLLSAQSGRLMHLGYVPTK